MLRQTVTLATAFILLQDYPSVGQISYALDKSKKHVIFAVKNKVYDDFLMVKERVPRSSVNKLETGQDSNILSIVRDKYRVSSVKGIVFVAGIEMI